jgi:hypothetical protein
MSTATPILRLASDGRTFIDASGACAAHLSALNPLECQSWAEDAGLLPSGMIVLRTGWADSPEPLWLPRYRECFERFVEDVERSSVSARIVWWPRATDVLSDAPSLLTFLRASPQRRFLFDPHGLLSVAMLTKAEDHLARLEEALGAHPACWARLARDGL